MKRIFRYFDLVRTCQEAQLMSLWTKLTQMVSFNFVMGHQKSNTESLYEDGIVRMGNTAQIAM